MEVIDTWRAAKLLLDNLGDEAPRHAERQISDLTMQGDKAGAEVWREILAAIAALRQTEGLPGTRLN